MKKLFTIIAFLCMVAIASVTHGQPLGPGGIYGGGGGTGNVTSTSDAQTWGGGTGPVVWTFSVTGTDPTISVATGAFTFNTDLALGANDITMTGSLGATGARVTKGWFTDLEVTNAIAGSVTGNAATATALAADPADCSAGYVATGIAASGALTCTNTLSVTIDDSAAQFVGATTDHTGKAKIDLTTSTPTKTTTLKLANADDATITFPSVTSTLVAETVATGGVILGDTSPDAAGELGYASTQLIFHDGTAARNVAKAGTLTNTKWCTTDGTVINCAEDAPAGAGDITAVGSCTSGSCATIGNADTSGGYIDFLEDSDNGTNYVRLKAPDSTADATVTLPNTTGTLAILGANTFTADQTITGNILPEAANTRTIGSATAEWADLYLGDGAVINLGNDQDVTLTHVADTGILLSSTDQFQFGDSGTYINQSADGILNIATDTEVKILVNDEDIKFTKTGTNGITLGTNTATSKITTAISIASSGEITGLIPPVVVALSSGVHDGGNDQATMTDGGIDLGANTLIGMTVYNVTDGSSCTITAHAATTITCTLAGGTGNDWDDNDVWQVGPGPYQSGSMFMVAGATTIRHPATAGYTACYMAEGTNKLTIDMASDSMVFSGVLDAAVVTLDAGDSIDSSDTTTDDFICLFNKSATVVKGLGKRGTWADGGAS